MLFHGLFSERRDMTKTHTQRGKAIVTDGKVQ